MSRPCRAKASRLKSDFYSRLMMQLEGRDAKISDGIYDERMVQVRCSFSSEFTFCRNLLPYRLRPRVRRLSCVYQFQSTPAELFECERAREKIRSQESSEIIAG